MKFGTIATAASSVDADLLVLGCFNGAEGTAHLQHVDAALGGAIQALARQGDLPGKPLETTMLHPFGRMRAQRVLMIGLGDREKLTRNLIRDAAATAAKAASKTKSVRVAALLPSEGASVSPADAAQAFAEGFVLGQYEFPGYASEKRSQFAVESVELVVANSDAEVQAALDTGAILAEATNWARDLINTPGNRLTPAVMAQKAADLAAEFGFACEVLEPADMERLGMGGLLAVAQGSEEPPRLIVLKYQGREQWDDVTAFVGKGITFDTGGISLKPADKMDEMKMDMGGAGAVLGAMAAIGRLKPAVNIVAVVPAAENMPSGRAYKPGDVITTMSGKTIEVLNTDAEGRIVLADAVTYAQRLGAARLVDLATLTGAVVVALGHAASAVLTNDESFLQQFVRAAEQAGEKVWQLPAFDEYKEQIKSDIADLKNTGGRPAGTITGGLFIGAFVDVPWVHVDIAGTAWTTDNKKPVLPKGATGVMVRTLVQLALDLARA